MEKRKLGLMTIALMLCAMAVVSSVAPSYAYASRYIKIGNKYLTVESNGCYIEWWWRSNPYACSIGDKIVARITCSDVKKAWDAAQQCFMCISWISGSLICTKFTLSGIATTLVCYSAYGSAILACSKCGADVVGQLISPLIS
jgi:hypothetical protein